MKKAKRKNQALGHAFLMVGRNIKSYVLLSVTIILSFSLLLGFFMWTDSRIYNKYKDILSASPYVGMFYQAYSGSINPDLGIDITNARYAIFIDKMKHMENTYYYQFYESSIAPELTQYEDEFHSITAIIVYVPNDYFGYYIQYPYIQKVNMISGESSFTSDDEVIIDKDFYDLLYDKQGKTAVTVKIPVKVSDGVTALKTFRVIGVYEDIMTSCVKSYDVSGNTHYAYTVSVLMPQTAAKAFDGSYANRRMLVYSERHMPEIFALARQLNIGGNTNEYYLAQARAEIRTQVFLKGLAALALFVLLGINLYSCFKNALNERRFEIGVKRAIGAPKKAVVGQFFREGMIVMVSNIAFSVYLIFNLAVIYKAVQKVFFRTTWTIDLSPYSAAIFLFSAFFLSVSFSLLFAYQSTNVEIAGQLKAE